MNGTDSGAVQNDVWGTLERLGGQVIGAVTDYKKNKTQAAPSGGVVYTNASNPFPGTQGAYPQAEAKPAPGGVGFSFTLANLPSMLIWLGVALLVVALLRKG